MTMLVTVSMTMTVSMPGTVTDHEYYYMLHVCGSKTFSHVVYRLAYVCE